MSDTFNILNVPAPLRRFAALARKYGEYSADRQLELLFVDEDSPEYREMEVFTRSWTSEHQEVYEQWIQEDMSAHELGCFDRLFGLLDEFELPPPGRPLVTTVDTLIQDLARHGSRLRDTGRMWAARCLPDYGPDARKAVPLLRQALEDEDPRVRVWAHCTLALIEGDKESHLSAIEAIARTHGDEDRNWVGREAESAFKAALRSPQEIAREAIFGFCITGNLQEVRRLVESEGVDVNAPSKDGITALQYAVGGHDPELARYLLARGANPNVRCKRGQTPLHHAAGHRRKAEVIRLLVEYGADVNARDNEGKTSLAIALEYGRKRHVAVLRELGGE